MFGLDDKTFAMVAVSSFMNVMGILQLPAVLGPSFTPFGSRILSPFMDATTWKVGKVDSKYSHIKEESTRNLQLDANGESARTKRKRNRKRNKTKTT